MANTFKIRIKELEGVMEDRLRKGMEQAMGYAADQLRLRLSENVGAPSVPGEYPSWQTGQGADNVVSEVTDDLQGGFGYVHQESTKPIRKPHREPGARHLTILTFSGRKGPAELFFEERKQIEAEFKKGAKL